jgi:hypothetical protein
MIMFKFYPNLSLPCDIWLAHVCTAFILYRQHHQATVVQQNPGLANPEISKVIGDHWRSSPPDVKNHWKCLADVCQSPHVTILANH